VIWLLALTFLCGATYELACVFWVHYCEAGRTWPAVGWSCFAALVMVSGLGEAIRRPLFIAAYVLGFGAGTGLAIQVKRRMGKDCRPRPTTKGADRGRTRLEWVPWRDRLTGKWMVGSPAAKANYQRAEDEYEAAKRATSFRP
jgi:hypothetical protein